MPFAMNSMPECIFCKIVKKEIPCYLVYEDDISLAFLDIHPSAPGHTMVILKKHGLSIFDYTEEELGNLMVRTQKLAKRIQEVQKCDWISIGINHLEPTGVPHLHIHLIPRWNTDKGRSLQGIVTNPPKESLEEIAKNLRNDT